MHARHMDGLTLALTAAILSCALSCASIPHTNYYVLGLSHNPDQTTHESKFPHTLAIAPFKSESTYARKKIIWRSGPNHLGYYPYDRWAALPAEMFSHRLYQRALNSNLFGRVLSGAASEDADLILKGRITSFEEVDTREGWFGKVEVEAELVQSDGTVIWSGIVGHTEPAAEESVDAAVNAIARATEATITIILSSAERSLRTNQAR
jgi:ABC-type uncharacterized transport system auxiliary subunit